MYTYMYPKSNKRTNYAGMPTHAREYTRKHIHVLAHACMAVKRAQTLAQTSCDTHLFTCLQHMWVTYPGR